MTLLPTISVLARKNSLALLGSFNCVCVNSSQLIIVLKVKNCHGLPNVSRRYTTAAQKQTNLLNKIPSQIPIYFGDAFTSNANSAFTGNPGVACVLEYDNDISDETKQKIANEMNVTATAFLSKDWTNSESNSTTSVGEANQVIRKGEILKTEDDKLLIRRKVRWFSLQSELPLCGHATLISAKLLGQTLFEMNPNLKDSFDEVQIEFESKFRGTLKANYNHKTGKVTLNFPSSPCSPLQDLTSDLTNKLADALLSSSNNFKMIQDVQYSSSSALALVRLQDDISPEEFRQIAPNFEQLKSIKLKENMLGLILTMKGQYGDLERERPHFYSRFFSPWMGFNEDAVTGSSHTVLTPYWFNEFGYDFGKTLLAKQHSFRGGFVHCSLINKARVTLGGDARINIRGNFFL